MVTEDTETFGELLRSYRHGAHLTQEELAEASGVSTRAIADLERGIIRAPQRETLEMLANALALSDEERATWRQLRSKLSTRTSSRTIGTQLPQPPNPLLGRDRELTGLANLLTHSGARLVSITGPGGVGKTRLALEIAHRLTSSYSDGVHFVELAAVSDPSSLILTIAQRLGIREGNPEAIEERLLEFLASRRMLLVLDNAEHLRSAATKLGSLLERTSSLQLLVTSRAGLRISGEHEFPISPLPLPEWDSSPNIMRLTENPAIELFLQRAIQMRPDFALTEGNHRAVSQVCSLLDGLPLALELAAARIRVLTPEQMVTRLADRLEFLSDGMADAPGRHRTMREAIAWSYELLTENDQQLFRRLSVFVDGWTIDAADEIALPDHNALDGLTRLTNDNLVQVIQSTEESRFRMLDTVREFGLEQLQRHDELEQTTRQLAGHFLALAEQAEPELRGAGQKEWIQRLDREMGNLRTALKRSLAPDIEPDIGQRLAAALTWFWESRGHVSEGRTWLNHVLQREPADPGVRMKALAGAGWLAHIQRDTPDARELLKESLTLARSLDDRWSESWALHLLGRVAYFDGDHDAARELGIQSLDIAQAIADRWLMAWAYHLLALAAHIEGDFQSARSNYAASLEIREELGYQEGIGTVTGLLGMLSLNEGDHHAALQLLQKSLETNRDLGARWLVVNMVANITTIATTLGDHGRAARLAGFVSAMSEVVGAGPIPIAERIFQQGLDTIRSTLDADTLHLAWSEGRAMALDEAVDIALLIGNERRDD